MPLPAPSPGPQPPGHAPLVPPGPQPPSKAPLVPPGPQPPGHGFRPLEVKMQGQLSDSGLPSNVGVLEKPETLTAQCIVLDEFLAPQELQDLITYSLQHECEFQASEVISPAANAGVIDYEHRRSRVLMDIGKHEGVIVERIKSVLPLVLARLGMEESPIASVESQITASNDGDFFREQPRQWARRRGDAPSDVCLLLPSRTKAIRWGRIAHPRRAAARRTLCQHGQLPNHRAAAEPDRIFPVRSAARNYPGEVPIASLRRQPLHPERMASPIRTGNNGLREMPCYNSNSPAYLPRQSCDLL